MRLDPLFESHRAQVYAWAYRILQREHDAQDVTQDVYLRWWHSRSNGAALTSPAAWLRRVTVNRALDVLRERHRDPQDDFRLAPSGVGRCDGTAPTAGARAEERERRERVSRALGGISERQREVVVAKVFDGLTFAAIAAQMNLSVPTVKTHYLRGLAALRDALHAERVT
ncbi:MAG: RNA polymerase sigma factor [Phycisphaerales bacterium]|nr:MAG: RNA polymerase sigma factor [Phycisphaerales bacterium]